MVIQLYGNAGLAQEHNGVQVCGNTGQIDSAREITQNNGFSLNLLGKPSCLIILLLEIVSCTAY